MVGGKPGATPIRGRFAAKTPRQSKGFPGAQHGSSGYSSSTSDGETKAQPTAPARKPKKESMISVLLPFIKVAIFISAMIAIALVFFIVTTFIVRHVHHHGVWESHEYPAEVEFHEIAVSSTSQSCNELARVMISEEYGIFAIALAMQLCLGLTEPHKGGFGGVSTAIYAEGYRRNYQLLDGFWNISNQLIIKNVSGGGVANQKLKKLAQSVLLPSDAAVAKYFLTKLQPDEEKRLARFLKEYELGKQPLSFSLFRAINHNTLRLLHSTDYKWLFNRREHFRPLDEGEIFTRKFATNLFREIKKSESAKQWMQAMIERSLEDTFSGTNIELTDAKWEMNETQESCYDVNKAASVVLCTPQRLGKLISTILSEEEDYQEQKLMLKEAMARLKILTELQRRSTTNPERKRFLKRVGRSSDPMRSTDATGWDANMFTILDLKSNRAISYVSTLGSKFGSGMNTEEQYLNDMSQYDTSNSLSGLFPAVAKGKMKIKFAYAAVGGSLAYTRSLPRMVTSYLLNLFHGVNLTSTLGWPILYEMEGAAYKDGVPFADLLNKRHNPTKAPNLADEAVSIEVKGESTLSAAHKNVKEHYSLIPSGI